MQSVLLTQIFWNIEIALFSFMCFPELTIRNPLVWNPPYTRSMELPLGLFILWYLMQLGSRFRP